MSYSFTVKAADKSAAKAAVKESLDQVVANQPVHSRDRVQALATAEAFIDQVADDPESDVNVYVAGSLSWSQSAGQDPAEDPVLVTAASCSVQAYLSKRA
jgi:hypothetical protein